MDFLRVHGMLWPCWYVHDNDWEADHAMHEWDLEDLRDMLPGQPIYSDKNGDRVIGKIESAYVDTRRNLFIHASLEAEDPFVQMNVAHGSHRTFDINVTLPTVEERDAREIHHSLEGGWDGMLHFTDMFKPLVFVTEKSTFQMHPRFEFTQ